MRTPSNKEEFIMKESNRGTKDEIETWFNRYTFGCIVVACGITVVFGYDTGVMSGAIIFIQEELLINDTQVEVLVGILNLCALVGSLMAGRISDYIGRRYTIGIASVIFLLGSVLMGYSPNYTVLMIGRCTAGIGVGFALMIAPVYSAEMSSATHRGLLSSLPELCIAVGILIGYLSNYFFGKLTLKLGWRLMLAVAAIPSLMLAVGIMRMPESPRWLVMKGRLADANRVLLQISNTPEEAEAQLHKIISATEIDENCKADVIEVRRIMSSGHGVWKELLLRPTPTVPWILLAAIGIHFFEHATGIEAVILYGPRIFKKAGVHSKDKLLLTTVGVGLTKTAFILIAMTLLDNVGRRKLLLVSTTGILFALTALAFSLKVVEQAKQQVQWVLVASIVATYTYVAFFNIGIAPITWVYSSEIFPLKLRAQGHSIGVAVNRGMNALISMTFLSLSKAITIGGTFFLFAGIAVVALLFFYFLFPETKGKSLEEIEALFTRGGNKQDNKDVEIQARAVN